MTDLGGSSRGSRGGLTECSRCRGVFGPGDLLQVRGDPVCRPCGKRYGLQESCADLAAHAKPISRLKAPPSAAAASRSQFPLRKSAPTTSQVPGTESPSSPPSPPTVRTQALFPPAPSLKTPPAPPPIPASTDGPRSTDGPSSTGDPSSPGTRRSMGVPSSTGFPWSAAAAPRLEAPVAGGPKFAHTPRLQSGPAPGAIGSGAAIVRGSPRPPILAHAPRTTGGSVAANQEAAFAEYSALRQRIESGEDTLETRKGAAELASRLNLGYEAVEHYERWSALAPNDLRVQMVLENVRRSAGLLPDGRAAEPPPPEPAGRAATESAPFWEELGDVIAWPFRGNGPAVLLVGGFCFGVAQILGAFNVFGWVVSLGLWGYVSSYLFSVINVSAAGRKSPPELPETGDLLESYVFPFFAFLSCGVISYAPFLVGLFAWARGWLPGPVGPVVSVLLFALGAFVFPMTLLIRAMFQSLGEAARPSMVLGSIGRILPDYIACYVALAVVWTVCAAAHGAMWFVCFVTLGAPTPDAVLEFDGIRVVSWLLYTIVSWPAFLYTWTLEGHLLGRVYRQGLQRLAWFVMPTEATRRARKMSAVLWVCAAGAALLLCGVAWLGSKLIDVRSGRLSVGGLTEQCPLRDGSRLAYFWDHTDGGAGLTEYSFHQVAGGLLRVQATTRFAGRASDPSSEELGTFDPSTGAWVTAAATGDSGGTIAGLVGEHVPFYGPKRSSVGATYVDDWVVRESTIWRGTWTTWRLVHPRTTAEFYYDAKSGILVGRRMPGIGWTSTSWLVSSASVPGATQGPPPPYDFSGASDEPGVGPPRDAFAPPPERNGAFDSDDDE